MVRLLAAAVSLGLAASPAFACPFQSSAVETQTNTAAAQPTQPAPCPTCVAPATTPTATPTQG
jgi:hypothetical protein